MPSMGFVRSVGEKVRLHTENIAGSVYTNAMKDTTNTLQTCRKSGSKRKEKKLVKELKRNMLSGKLPENVYVAEKSQQNPEKLCVRCV